MNMCDLLIVSHSVLKQVFAQQVPHLAGNLRCYWGPEGTNIFSQFLLLPILFNENTILQKLIGNQDLKAVFSYTP